MSLPRRRPLWALLNALVTLAVFGATGYALYRPLARLGEYDLGWHPGYLAAAGASYLAGLGLSAVYWHRLLHSLGQRPPGPALAWAFFFGHLAKYVPGKAMIVIVRAAI